MEASGSYEVIDMLREERYVYIVDDDRDIRRSLHLMLTSASLKPRSFALAQDFIDELVHLTPGTVLLDLRMPELNGFEVLEILDKLAIKWPVIMITAHGDVSTAVQAIKLGALDFIEKPFSTEALENILNDAYLFLEHSIPSWRRRYETRQLFSHLTKREFEVVEILIEGARNKEVAHRLDISVRTVEVHRRNVLAKLGVRSLAEVMALAATAEIGTGANLSDFRKPGSVVV